MHRVRLFGATSQRSWRLKQVRWRAGVGRVSSLESRSVYPACVRAPASTRRVLPRHRHDTPRCAQRRMSALCIVICIVLLIADCLAPWGGFAHAASDAFSAHSGPVLRLTGL
jgi:hypothetical protein